MRILKYITFVLLASSKLWDFVQSMASLGKYESYKVLPHQDFNSLLNGNTTSGWWNFIGNRLGTKTSNHVSETKQLILNRTKRNSVMDEITRLQNSPHFVKDLVAVVFIPFLLPNVDRSSQLESNKLFSLLNKVATRFHTVRLGMDIIPSGIADSEVLLMHEVVAKFNKMRPLSQLKVISAIKYHNETSLNLYLNKIIQTNQVYPGTVELVLMSISGTNVKTVLSKMHAKLNSGESSSMPEVKLCLQYPLEFCNDLSYNEVVSNVETSGCVYYTYIHGNSTYVYYNRIKIDQILKETITRFEKCKQNTLQNVPGAKVGFEVGYSDSHGLEYGNYASFAIFWDTITSWAVKTNTSIIFAHAFDVPHNPSIFASMGWWKVTEFSSNTGEHNFQEKRILALEALQNKLENRNVKNNVPSLTFFTSRMAISFATPLLLVTQIGFPIKM